MFDTTSAVRLSSRRAVLEPWASGTPSVVEAQGESQQPDVPATIGEIVTCPDDLEMTGIAWLGQVPPPLAGCWYLGHHWDMDRRCRTVFGRLVYRAKTYDGKPGQRAAADELGLIMARASVAASKNRWFPLIDVSAVLAVPSFPEKHPFNLPDVLASHLAEKLGVPLLTNGLVKTRTTPPAKTTPAKEILAASIGAYEVHADVKDETVLLVDDLVHSGATLAGIASHLNASGAASVGGFAATRAYKGLGKQ